MRDELGSAEFSQYKGLTWNEFGANLNKALFIGKSQVDPSRIIAMPNTRHMLSVAPTRSGKGSSLIIPNLLMYPGSSIVIDPKGENAWITGQFRSWGDRARVHILDPWHEVDRRYVDFFTKGGHEPTATYNPLDILDPKSETYADDIAYIADALIINQGKEPFWDDSARELVAGLIAYAVEAYPDQACLPMVRAMIIKPPQTLVCFANLAKNDLGPDSYAAQKLSRFSVESKENASILSTAQTQTAFLDAPALAENMFESTFSFEEIADPELQTNIYLVLPPDKLVTHGRWLRLLVSIGIRTMARNTKRLPAPVLFLLDEFGTIGRLSSVAQAYGLMAGLQVCCWAFVQDLNQLKKDYPDEWQTFIANSEGVTFFHVSDPFTAEFVSKAMGTKTVEVISEATYEKRTGTKGFFFNTPGDPNYSAMADQVYARPLMTPEEVRMLSRKQGILLHRGAPIIFGIYPYYENKDYYERVRPDPAYPETHAEMKAARDRLVNKNKNRMATEAIPTEEKGFEYLIEKGFTINRKKSFLSGEKYEVIYPQNYQTEKLTKAETLELARQLYIKIRWPDKKG